MVSFLRRRAGVFVVAAYISAVLTSCVTGSFSSPDLKVIESHIGIAYEFPSGNNDVLVFYLEGSGLHSVLGVRGRLGWKSHTFLWFLAEAWQDQVSIVVPEKPGMEPGTDHSSDMAVLRSYTVEAHSTHYAALIDAYLEKHPGANQVFLFGVSEGGLLLPAVYHRLEHKDRINKLVVWGAGGLSQAESFRVLADSPVSMPSQYREQCRRIDEVRVLVADNPHSFRDWYFGWPYHRWSSYFNYRPVDYYEHVSIPSLFIHGTEDWSSPVESTRHLERQYPDSPFTFRYIEGMGHFPETDREIYLMLEEILLWLLG